MVSNSTNLDPLLWNNLVGILLGFGSTARLPIEEDGVHYDCGCIIDEKGQIIQFSQILDTLNAPAIYVAYFSTFGAMVI